MLLTILNLPYTVTFNDIKALIYSKCGIDEVILDNLVPHDNRTKKVTIGLSGEEDAAIFTKKIDGVMMNGHQLRVLSKTRIPKLSTNANQRPSQPGFLSSMAPLMGPGPISLQGANFGLPQPSMPNQNIPTMVPPPQPMKFGGPNVFYPNQSAYYMMNQSTCPTRPSGSNLGYQNTPFGNTSNQGCAKDSWSNNDWNQQQQSDQSQNAQSKIERGYSWDKGDSQWNDNNSKWNSSNTSWDGNNSNRDNSNPKWGNNKWDNSASKRGNNNPQWNDSRGPEWSNNRESRWNKNDGSDWDSRNDLRSNSSRDSKWQSNRDSNRDNTYRSNQTAGPSRDRDSPNRRYNQDVSQRPSQSLYGDHVTYSPGDGFNRRDNEPQQDRYKTGPRQRSPVDRDRGQSPSYKRPRNERSDYGPSGPLDKTDVKSQRAIQIGRMWRGQFIACKTRDILADPRFQYETPNPAKLRQALTANVKKRVNNHFPENCSMPVHQMEQKYNKINGFQGDWVALRDSLQKVGGRLLSKVNAGDNNAPSKKAKKKKSPNPPQFGEAIILQQGLQQAQKFGAMQQQAAQFTGQQQQTTQQQTTQQQTTQQLNPPQPSIPKLGKTKKGKGKKKPGSVTENKNPGSKPLASIPGRIPQYPQGDKRLFKKNKNDQKAILGSDLSSPIFDDIKPALRKAIDEEVDLMCKVISQVCGTPGDEPDAAIFCKHVMNEVPEEMARVLKVNIAKRLIPILPMSVRVFAYPHIKRTALETFLQKFNVISFLRAKHQSYYVAACRTVADHDYLCTMDPVTVEGSVLTFKPFHMVDAMKVDKKQCAQVFIGGSQKTVAEPKTEKDPAQPQSEGVPNNDGVPKNDDDDDDYEVEEYYDDGIDEQEFAADATKDENLCQEMKQLYDKINNSEVNENDVQTNDNEEHYKVKLESNEEAYQAFKAVQVIDTGDNEDFTNDIDIDNITSNVSEQAPKKNPVQDQGNGDVGYIDNQGEFLENQNKEDNIDMADVNEEDLEDW